jgi:predicted RNA binding protein YcfA (HicA-like mRNA interferase family)
MPPKVRELKAELRKAGFKARSGKGSHTVWEHPLLTEAVALAGNDGNDAKPYQVNDVRKALRALQEEQGRQQ